MSKKKREIAQDHDQVACATATAISGSVQKVNLVCSVIRGMDVEKAMLQLNFSRKALAKELASVLNSAIANAENNFGLDVDRLTIDKIFVGKSFVLKRFHARGRGRASKISKPTSRVTIYVKEKEGYGSEG